jgi:hypothetical protein
MSTPPGADRIEQVAFGFMASKVLFSAIELGLFSELAKGPFDAGEIRKRLGLHPRSVRDFLDALVVRWMGAIVRIATFARWTTTQPRARAYVHTPSLLSGAPATQNFREAAFSPTRRLSVRPAVTKSPEKLRKTWVSKKQ